MKRMFVVGLLTGVGLVFGVMGWTRPDCPTETSCRPDYQHHWYGGSWTGVPDPTLDEDPR